MKHLLLVSYIIIAVIFGIAVGMQVSLVFAGADDYYYQQWYIEVPQVLTDWQSLNELKAFLAVDDTDTHRYIKLNSSGEGIFTQTCVDQAEHLRDMAAKNGKHLEVQPLSPSEYRRIFNETMDGYTAINLARVGDFYYAIIPDTDMVKKAYHIP